MKNFFRLLFKKTNQAIPDTRTQKQKFYDDFRDYLKCPCCQDEDCFLEGPSGGICVNVMCTSCGSRFNVSVFGLDWTHGPQDKIWNGITQTKFPSAERVKMVEESLSR